MIELKTGEVYLATRANGGESGKGPWQYVAVREDGKGRKEIVIWVENRPQPITAESRFRIKTIHSVKFASRKDNAGVWHDEVNVSADIEPVMSVDQAVTNGINVYPPSSSTFEDLGEDGELPF